VIKDLDMALTRDFRETVMVRAAHDPVFRAGLYEEALQALVDGDFGTARILLRDYINATLGFGALAARVGATDKSLMRMFGPAGNPHAANLAAVLRVLGEECRVGVTVEAQVGKRRRVAVARAAA
jgi:DNA-binding phage protein